MLKTIAQIRAAGDLAALNALIPYARTVGLEVRREADGGLVTVLAFREDNIGNHLIRAIHGGVVGALLEHAAVTHLLLETEVQVVPRIINLSVDYLRPARATETLAQGTIVR